MGRGAGVWFIAVLLALGAVGCANWVRVPYEPRPDRVTDPASEIQAILRRRGDTMLSHAPPSEITRNEIREVYGWSRGGNCCGSTNWGPTNLDVVLPRSEFRRLEIVTSNGVYKLLRVVHHANHSQVLGEDAGGEFSYHNEFVCMESAVPYRPPRVTPRPFVRGIQSATVVGPPSEEIHTDEQGRVKVQFHWDRRGKHDEHSSCWIRVSQLWAGAGWGAMWLPRIGHEVLVDFIEGDPDRPIVTGRVYHGLNDTPYALPQEKTKSTIKSDSSLGGGGFNEFRFEDRKSNEQVFLHAERNLDIYVKNDRMETVLHDRHLTVGNLVDGGKVGTKCEEVIKDKHVKVHRHEHRHTGGDVYIRIGGVDGDGHQHVTIEANQHERVEKDAHLHVLGDRRTLIDKQDSHIVRGDSHSYTVGLHALEAGKEVHLKAPKLVIEATTAITIKGPGGFITIDASGVVVQGTLVRINSGGSALSGSGANPASAVDPKPAEPLGPLLADKGG